MARSRSLLLVALALTLTACKPGCRGGDEAATPEETTAAALARVRPVEIPFERAALVPNDADAYVLADVSFLAERAAALTPGVANASELWESLQAQFDALAASPDAPETIRAGVRPAALQSLVAAAWDARADGDTESSWVVITDTGVLASPPEDGATPVVLDDDVRMAARGGDLIFGDGPRFDAIVSGDIGDAFVGTAAWPEGWSHVPEDAGVVVFVPRPNEDFPESWASSGFRSGLIATGPGSSSVFAVDVDDDTIIRNYLGGAQRKLDDQLTRWRTMAPPVAQGWVDYIDLATRALWSQLSLTREGTVTAVEIAAPRCGSGAASIYLLAGLAWLGPDDGQLQPTPFEPVPQRIADDCGPIPGPAPALPARFAGMPGAGTDGEQLLVLADVGALLRANLPTFFHVLPFALHPDDVVEALGETPLGLAGLADPNGVVAVYADMAGGAAAVVLPAGARGFLPIPVPPGLASELVEGVGWVIAAPGHAERVSNEAESGSPWARLVAALPERSVLAAMGTRRSVADLIADLPFETRVMSESDLFAAAVDADLAATFAFYVGSDAPAIAEATRADIARAAEAPADAGDIDEAMFRAVAAPMRDALVVEASGDDVVLVRVGQTAAQGRAFLLGGAAAAVIIPQLMNPYGPLADIMEGGSGPAPIAVPATPGLTPKPPAAGNKPPR